ncbi:MAG: hypothetical protein R3B57_08345 [Phycisphaerales bacterium]
MGDETNTTAGSDQGGALAGVTTEKSAAEVVASLERMSKRGELPGFDKDEARGLFSVEAAGNPFDRRLVAHAKERDGLTILEWELVTPRKWPIIIAAVLVVTVWPGLPITHSLLVNYFPGWYGGLVSGWFKTWMWYLPLTILPIPWAWRSTMKKMRATTLISAREAVAKIAGAVGGQMGNETAMG